MDQKFAGRCRMWAKLISTLEKSTSNITRFATINRRNLKVVSCQVERFLASDQEHDFDFLIPMTSHRHLTQTLATFPVTVGFYKRSNRYAAKINKNPQVKTIKSALIEKLTIQLGLFND